METRKNIIRNRYMYVNIYYYMLKSYFINFLKVNYNIHFNFNINKDDIVRYD